MIFKICTHYSICNYMKSVNILQQTRPTTQIRQNAVNLNQNDLIRALVETSLVPHFCLFGHLFTCSNFNSYVAVVETKEYNPLASSHKVRKARIQCFVTFVPRLVST